jgi:N-acetylglucosaminyl-diphospho-decaprenol L-rhamnosyltransferase
MVDSGQPSAADASAARAALARAEGRSARDQVPRSMSSQLAASTATRSYAVVIVVYRSKRLLSSILDRIPLPTPIIVVDNSAATDDITDLVSMRPETTYINSGGNIGFGAACNLGAEAAAEPFIAFVNPDAGVDTTVLDDLVSQIASDPQCSSCGPILLDADGQVSSGSGGWLPTPWRALVHATGLFRFFPQGGIGTGPLEPIPVSVEWIAGTCLMIRREVFLAVGGFSANYFLYQEDMDLGRRLSSRGYRQVIRGDRPVRHVAGTSSELQDVRSLAWRRASALVHYLADTQGKWVWRLTCAILTIGMLLRGGYALCRLRTARVAEFAVHVTTLGLPGRTLKLVRAEQQARATPLTPSAKRDTSVRSAHA